MPNSRIALTSTRATTPAMPRCSRHGTWRIGHRTTHGVIPWRDGNAQ